MGKHAILSPSGFKALMLCPAKPAMDRGIPERSSDYADEGTAAQRARLRGQLLDFLARRRHRTTVSDEAVERATGAYKRAGVFFGQW